MKPENGKLIGFPYHRSTRKPAGEYAANPNDLIDTIVDAIDYAETARDAQGLIKARRLLNNDLRQAIDLFVQDEVIRVLKKGQPGLGSRR